MVLFTMYDGLLEYTYLFTWNALPASRRLIRHDRAPLFVDLYSGVVMGPNLVPIYLRA